MKRVTLRDFLTDEEILEALRIYREHTSMRAAAAAIAATVVGPQIERINRALGQENDPMYLAYMCLVVFIETKQ